MHFKLPARTLAAISRSISMSSHLRFAPLSSPSSSSAPSLSGVVFDVDGTLCEPQTWMFSQMRTHLQIPSSTDILTHVSSLPSHERKPAMELIESVEREAMLKMVPSRGLLDLLSFLDARGVKRGILTKNNEAPIQHLITTHCQGLSFSPIVTREFQPSKPSPAGLLHIAQTWGLENCEGLVMVGDSIDDMEAGRKAGAATILLANEANRNLGGHEFTDCVVEELGEIVGLLESGFAVKRSNLEDVRESGEAVMGESAAA